MSQSQRDTNGGLRGGREVAYRLFGAEYADATYSYSESDEERAPNYVVTPTGVRTNRLFVVGVLTEISPAGESMLRARVADPTGAFVVYAGQYQPDALSFLDTVSPPAFLAVTGKARTFSPDDTDVVYTSIRPEAITEVDSDTRDRWTVSTAERTLERIATVENALSSARSGGELTRQLLDDGVNPSLATGIPIALSQYGTTEAYLAALQRCSLDTLALVAGEVDAVDELAHSPGDEQSVSFTPVFENKVTDTATTQPPDSAEEDVEATEDEFDPGELDPGEFELDAEVRDEVESEFGTEFSTAAEVSSETGDETLENESAPETETEPTADVDTDEAEPTADVDTNEAEPTADVDTDEAETDGDADTEKTEPPEEVDVTSVLLQTMGELDDGDGVDRSVLIERVSEAAGVSEQAVSEAIQDALMSGQCYEPASDMLKPI